MGGRVAQPGIGHVRADGKDYGWLPVNSSRGQ